MLRLFHVNLYFQLAIFIGAAYRELRYLWVRRVKIERIVTAIDAYLLAVIAKILGYSRVGKFKGLIKRNTTYIS